MYKDYDNYRTYIRFGGNIIRAVVYFGRSRAKNVLPAAPRHRREDKQAAA